MRLRLANLYTKAEGSAEELSRIRAFLEVRQSVFNGKQRVVRVSSLLYPGDYFPSGLVPDVVREFEAEVEDTREPPELAEWWIFDHIGDWPEQVGWLRDYQREAVVRTIKYTRGILWLPTNAGKTEVIIALALVTPCVWLYLVHRSSVAKQTARKYKERTGIQAGLVAEGEKHIPDDCTFICATFQTLAAMLESKDESEREWAKKLLQSGRGVAVDESHVAPASTFFRVLQQTPNAYYRVGLSATPMSRTDKMDYLSAAALGPVLLRVKPKLLIDRGDSAKPIVRFVRCHQTSNAKTLKGAYNALVVRSKMRNSTLLWIGKQARKPGLIFVRRKAHGRQLASQLTQAGMQAEFVCGGHTVDWLQSHINRLTKGHFDFLVCTEVADTGLDVGQLRSIIHAGGYKSTRMVVQQIGRGMRIEKDAKGNKLADSLAFDVWDVKDEGQHWLEEHADQRIEVLEKEGYEVQVLEVGNDE